MKSLEWCSPIVFTGEIRGLSKKIVCAYHRQGFLLMYGDCDKSLEYFDMDHVRDTFCVILQMATVLTLGGALLIIKVWRMVGQFAKPRLELDKVRYGVNMSLYQGGIFNSE